MEAPAPERAVGIQKQKTTRTGNLKRVFASRNRKEERLWRIDVHRVGGVENRGPPNREKHCGCNGDSAEFCVEWGLRLALFLSPDAKPVDALRWRNRFRQVFGKAGMHAPPGFQENHRIDIRAQPEPPADIARPPSSLSPFVENRHTFSAK